LSIARSWCRRGGGVEVSAVSAAAHDKARVVHFAGMNALVAFFVVHVVMVALAPRSLLLMIRGR
jgi:thiosulfate reductase cytochrome b subunit